jgi:hypothetical protein
MSFSDKDAPRSCALIDESGKKRAHRESLFFL